MSGRGLTIKVTGLNFAPTLYFAAEEENIENPPYSDDRLRSATPAQLEIMCERTGIKSEECLRDVVAKILKVQASGIWQPSLPSWNEELLEERCRHDESFLSKYGLPRDISANQALLWRDDVMALSDTLSTVVQQANEVIKLSGLSPSDKEVAEECFSTLLHAIRRGEHRSRQDVLVAIGHWKNASIGDYACKLVTALLETHHDVLVLREKCIREPSFGRIHRLQQLDQTTRAIVCLDLGGSGGQTSEEASLMATIASSFSRLSTSFMSGAASCGTPVRDGHMKDPDQTAPPSPNEEEEALPEPIRAEGEDGMQRLEPINLLDNLNDGGGEKVHDLIAFADSIPVGDQASDGGSDRGHDEDGGDEEPEEPADRQGDDHHEDGASNADESDPADNEEEHPEPGDNDEQVDDGAGSARDSSANHKRVSRGRSRKQKGKKRDRQAVEGEQEEAVPEESTRTKRYQSRQAKRDARQVQPSKVADSLNEAERGNRPGGDVDPVVGDDSVPDEEGVESNSSPVPHASPHNSIHDSPSERSDVLGASGEHDDDDENEESSAKEQGQKRDRVVEERSDEQQEAERDVQQEDEQMALADDPNQPRKTVGDAVVAVASAVSGEDGPPALEGQKKKRKKKDPEEKKRLARELLQEMDASIDENVLRVKNGIRRIAPPYLEEEHSGNDLLEDPTLLKDVVYSDDGEKDAELQQLWSLGRRGNAIDKVLTIFECNPSKGSQKEQWGLLPESISGKKKPKYNHALVYRKIALFFKTYPRFLYQTSVVRVTKWDKIISAFKLVFALDAEARTLWAIDPFASAPATDLAVAASSN